ncbi:uncharacterized protein LOC102573735 isoform X1 [Alligator mississippiensis]|uniref:uncharacterized protein LOC102573735 isoform X1 n=1 Tax=Alligator mississippiensis TaxID=8496 RepID=UPI0007121DA9|nr:uncharacterized protein LOC102573735 isoform X1 [Alligator mississippiensis]
MGPQDDSIGASGSLSIIQAMEAWRGPLEIERNPRRKILSLDRQDAKRVLELYVKHTLSNCEDSFAAKERLQEGSGGQVKKTARLQRSASDFCRYSSFRGIRRKSQADKAKAQQSEDAGSKKKKQVACGSTTDNEQKPKGKSSKNVPEGKSQYSGIKTFMNFLFRRNTDEHKEKSCRKKKDKDADKQQVPMEAEEVKRSRTDLNSSTQSRKANKKRTSFRKAFAFKKLVTEEEKGEGLEAGAKAKKSNLLPLENSQKPGVPDTEQHDQYCAQVSEEIELIIQSNESKGKKGHSYHEPPKPVSANEAEEAIRRIVSFLESAGDDWDKKIKEDVGLSAFFRNISYSSFKHLADVYVNNEVTASVPDRHPEEVQFAFAVHLTAKVAGICNHTVNRIMGFGNQYLQDSFAQFSYNRNLKDREMFRVNSCEGPD